MGNFHRRVERAASGAYRCGCCTLDFRICVAFKARFRPISFGRLPKKYAFTEVGIIWRLQRARSRCYPLDSFADSTRRTGPGRPSRTAAPTSTWRERADFAQRRRTGRLLSYYVGTWRADLTRARRVFREERSTVKAPEHALQDRKDRPLDRIETLIQRSGLRK